MIKRICSSFIALNTTQFIVTLNDSIFRLIVTYSLIDLLGEEKSNEILAISATLFVMPFIICSMPAGQMGDRMSKRTIILWTSWAELIFMILAYFAIYYNHEVTSYFALFLIALQSAFFSPMKYSIIPEIEPESRITRANGHMTLFTYLAILLGTFLASFLSEMTKRNFPLIVIFCILISVIAVVTSYMIEKTPVKDPDKKVNFFFLTQIFRSVKAAREYKHLNLALFSSAFFLYTASFTQLNLIPFGIESLGITDIQTGYVYLAAALGLGVGSFLVSIIASDSVKLWLSLWGGYGTATSYILLYVCQYNLILSCFLFFSIGMHGGLYIVPLDAYVQFISPEKSRGSFVSAGTFLSFVAVLCGAATLFLFGEVIDITAAQGYLMMGCFSMVVAILITFALHEKPPLEK
ncbi:MAG: Lysophospholipid transporter LplT [Chlamydiia bacterium]|nr:Lysophospholipid transporter LplT [Chlamydiia bacterium]